MFEHFGPPYLVSAVVYGPNQTEEVVIKTVAMVTSGGGELSDTKHETVSSLL